MQTNRQMDNGHTDRQAYRTKERQAKRREHRQIDRKKNRKTAL